MLDAEDGYYKRDTIEIAIFDKDLPPEDEELETKEDSSDSAPFGG